MKLKRFFTIIFIFVTILTSGNYPLEALAFNSGYEEITLTMFGNYSSSDSISGLYKDNVYFLSLDTLTDIAGVSIISETKDKAVITTNGGEREFTLNVKDSYVFEDIAPECKLSMPLCLYEGQVYISALHFLRYIGATVEIDQNAGIQFKMYMPYNIYDALSDYRKNVDAAYFHWMELECDVPELLDEVLGISVVAGIFNKDSNFIKFFFDTKSVYRECIEDTLLAILKNEGQEAMEDESFAEQLSNEMEWINRFIGYDEKALEAFKFVIQQAKEKVPSDGWSLLEDYASKAENIFDKGTDWSGTITSVVTNVHRLEQFRNVSETQKTLLESTLAKDLPTALKFLDDEKMFSMYRYAINNVSANIQNGYSRNINATVDIIKNMCTDKASKKMAIPLVEIWNLTADILKDIPYTADVLSRESSLFGAYNAYILENMDYQILSKLYSDWEKQNGFYDDSNKQLQCLKDIRNNMVFSYKTALTARELLIKSGIVLDDCIPIETDRNKTLIQMLHNLQNCQLVLIGENPKVDEDLTWMEYINNTKDHQHNEVIIPEQSATCTQMGRTEGTRCSVCGKDLVKQILTPMAEHSYVEGKCSVCGKTEERVSQGLRYEVNADGVTCTIEGMGQCTDADLYIPRSIDGFTVTSIGESAFSQEDIRSITIPETVTSIGENAFLACPFLATINIADSVTSIGAGAFSGTAFFENSSNWNEDVLYIGKSLIKAKRTLSGNYNIQEGTKCIAGSAFYDCFRLTKVTIPDSVINIEEGAFASCAGLTDVNIPDSVTNIGDGAFVYCRGLTDVTIPDSVTNIGASAFAYCIGLTNVSIPDSVTNIGEEAFYNTAFYKDDSNWSEGVLYAGGYLLDTKKDLSGTYHIQEGTTCIASRAFEDCRNLTSIIIPDSVTTIGNSAFGICIGLTSITIPNSVTSIGADAFWNCSSLIDVTIPDSVTSIGAYAFSDFDNLTNVTIPDDVTYIPSGAFSDCYNLTSVVIPNSVTSIGAYAFSDCYNLTSITIPDGVTYIGESAFSNCYNLTNVVIPDSVTNIGASAFSGCANLTNVVIPDSVTSIGSEAFSGCANLTSIIIPDGVTYIGYRAFYNTAFYKDDSNWSDGVLYAGGYLLDTKKDLSGAYNIQEGTTCIASDAFENCDNLISITIPDSVTYIASGAFNGCANLSNVIIPNSVTGIGQSAFAHCRGLTNITIPDSVTCIERYAFEECISLASINLPSGVTSICEEAFYGCESLTSITIPSSVTSIWKGVFEDCESLTNIVIPDSVTIIGTSAFSGCSSLTGITIPDSVTGIGKDAFYGCESLTSITIPGSVTCIGCQAFPNCDNLTVVTFEGTMEQYNAIYFYGGDKDDIGWDIDIISCTDGDIEI